MLRALLMWGLTGCWVLACATPPPKAVVGSLNYATDGICTPIGGAPGVAAQQESAILANQALDETFAALANERPEYHRQFIDHARSPLQRFPRLTFPSMSDPVEVAAGGARKSSAWLVPLVFDYGQLGDVPPEALTGEFAFWLVPHGAEVASANWLNITECLVRAGTPGGEILMRVSDRKPALMQPDEVFPTFARMERLRGVVFEIPTQAAGVAVSPDFYDLKVVPRLNALTGVAVNTPALAQLNAALARGDWAAAIVQIRAIEPASLTGAAAADDLEAMASRIAYGRFSPTSHPSPQFEIDIRALQGELRDLARAVVREPAGNGAVTLALSRLEHPIRSVLEGIHTLAPVALRVPSDEKGRCDGRDCLRIAVAGDFQYHGNLSALRRFLGMLDSTFNVGDEAPAGVVRDVDFVLFAGDLADAAAGSAKEQLLLNVLGILPPMSPYGEDGGREMLEIRDQLAQFDKPFYAVPGNHDGYAGYGGILNAFVDEFGNAIGEAVGLFNDRMGRFVGGKIKGVNDVVPTFIGWRLVNRQPRYDGLHEFQNYLGPLNVAFKFRGHSFIGLNTYDLKPRERSSIGGVVLHWGGGLQDNTLDWAEELINDFAPEADREQFLFMHHDPRAAAPTKSSYDEQQFGYYDAIDTPISWLTLGHFGFGNSPRIGIYLPTISFASTFIWRSIEIGWGDDAGTIQQVWMRKPDWGLPLLGENSWPKFFDHDAYNSRGFVEVIGCNLAGRTEASTFVERSGTKRCADPKGSISQILIAHDNVPVDTFWADENNRGAVFREPQRGQLWRDEGWEISGPGQFGALFGLKFRSGSPPIWAQEMLLDTKVDGNANVLRMDDVGDAGNYHGFHIITLYANGEKKSEWIALPH